MSALQLQASFAVGTLTALQIAFGAAKAQSDDLEAWGNETWGNDTWGNDTWGNETFGNETWGNETDFCDVYFNDTFGENGTYNGTYLDMDRIYGNETYADLYSNCSWWNDTDGNDTWSGDGEDEDEGSGFVWLDPCETGKHDCSVFQECVSNYTDVAIGNPWVYYCPMLPNPCEEADNVCAMNDEWCTLAPQFAHLYMNDILYELPVECIAKKCQNNPCGDFQTCTDTAPFTHTCVFDEMMCPGNPFTGLSPPDLGGFLPVVWHKKLQWGPRLAQIKWNSPDSVLLHAMIPAVSPQITGNVLTDEYTGFMLFNRKQCKAEFFQAIESGDITLHIFDYSVLYDVSFRHIKKDGAFTAASFQFVRRVGTNDWMKGGKTPSDKYALQVKGLAKLSKRPANSCFETLQFGTMSGNANNNTVNFAQCAVHDKKVGF